MQQNPSAVCPHLIVTDLFTLWWSADAVERALTPLRAGATEKNKAVYEVYNQNIEISIKIYLKNYF